MKKSTKRPYRENPSKGFIPPVVVENWAKGAMNPDIEKWERDIYLDRLNDLRIYVSNILTDSKLQTEIKKSRNH